MDNLNKSNIDQEQEIDLIEVGKKLWENRKFIFKVCSIALLVGIVIALSLPKEYTTKVILALEANSQTSGMSALAALAGINLQQNVDMELPLDLYPDIVTSTPFLMGLFDVQVQDVKRNIDTSLYVYLNENQKKAWWSYIFNAPFMLLDLFSSKKDKTTVAVQGSGSRVIKISEDQKRILGDLQSRIDVSVNNKTGEITLSSKMQSPIISAYLADTITSYMQSYIIDYRTQKARQDLVFTELLYNEAQMNYYKAQNNLSTYMDENLGIVSARYRNTQERLQNEASLAFGVYNQMAQQLQMARMKVQDTTPVYMIIQPAVVPLKASRLKGFLIVIVFLFLGGAGSCRWVFVKDSFARKVVDVKTVA